MILQWPRAGQGRDVKARASGEDAVEASLRRSLGSVHFVAYEPHAGGWPKRALDMGVTLITFPIWGSVMGVLALWAKQKHKTRVFSHEDRVGYGGATFKLRAMRLAAPTADIVTLHPPTEPQAANDDAPVPPRGWAKWRPVLERLPMLWSVLRGEMSLVGPRPRSADTLDDLSSAKKFYVSARPGLVWLAPEGASDEDEAMQVKFYVKSWMFETDLELLKAAWAKFKS